MGTREDAGDLQEPLLGFVMKICTGAYEITDGDIQRLTDGGYCEDAIFEAIISTAVGAGMSRLALGLAALRSGDDGCV
ncbi:MAG: hypothetical protein ACR2JC_00655 [Chloroflexota bacterium]|nr:MAG: hypothetical protein DLM70_16150 [Chloroflexota bacterium]